MIHLITQIVATLCAVVLAWHCRSTERAYLYQTHWLTDAGLEPRLRRADGIAFFALVAVLGGIWG